MPSAPPDLFGCQLWTGRVDREGYGYHGKSRAHIVAYEKANGPRPLDPEGKPLVLDHLCRRPACCSPHHLEAVTQSENELRKSWRYRAKRTHCPRGHELRGKDFNQVVTPEGGIVCRACNQEARSA